METRWRETLVFELAGRLYGLPASDVQELVRMVALTPPPPGLELVEGVINLRGAVVPVVDLRARLGLPPRPVDPSESLVIARRAGRLLAFRVDRPVELATLDAGDIESASVVEPGGGRASGVAKRPEGLVVLLDLGSLLEPIEAGPEPGSGDDDRS
jgi:purine-binding chemotaxis protein CheW